METCIRLLRAFERVEKSGWKEEVSGLEESLAAIRSGEEILFVNSLSEEDVCVISDELIANSSLLLLGLYGE